MLDGWKEEVQNRRRILEYYSFFSGIHANNLIFVTAWTASRAGLSTNFPK